MAVGVVVSELLCYVYNSFTRYDRTFIQDTVSKFYHEDELYAAKVELAKIVSELSNAPDGWSKMLSSKGSSPIVRRGADGPQRRSLEADDVLEMVTILDLNKIDVPRFVAADLDRIPGFAAKSLSATPSGLDEILHRLEEMEKKLTHVPNVQVSTTSRDAAMPKVNCDLPVPSAVESLPKTWADQAAEMAQANPSLSFSGGQRKVRLWGKAVDSASCVKGVPRFLTCFAGRLDADVTAEDLSEFLKAKGITDVKCVKLVAKDGHVFRTSAFRVSCSAVYESIFYNESSWPIGVELRDWIFYNRNGQ